MSASIPARLEKLSRTVDWSLTAQLFEHFGSTRKSVTGFADRDVENEFLDAQLSHGVCQLVLLRSLVGLRLRAI